MSGYEYGPTSSFATKVIGAGPGIRGVIVARVCPSCGADWQAKGALRLGHHAGRKVLRGGTYGSTERG